MKHLMRSVMAVILLLWGCTAALEQSGREVGGNRITILYSHYMSGYLEPCG